MALINWQNFRVQYFFIFTGLNLLKSFKLVDKVITTIGTSIVMMTTAYNLTKYIRTYFNQEFIPSVKKAVLITGKLKINYLIISNYIIFSIEKGADKGITYDLAIKLNEHGFRVYATVMEPTAPAVESLVSDSRFANLMKVKKMDVTNEEEVNKVVKEITEELNTNQEELWAVINGAETREFGHFDWSEFKLYEKIFNVNTFGTVRVVRAFLPLIRKSKGIDVSLPPLPSQ